MRPAYEGSEGAGWTPPAADASMRTLMLIFGGKATPMVRVAALLSVSIAMQGAAMAEDAKPDTVQVHGKSLALSCAEWKRNQDGSWTNASPLLVGTDTVNSVTLRGAKETNVLETKCANGSSPPAKPPQSDNATRHAGHRHRPAEPADGT
jgi:hypothetical protein